MVVVMSLCRCSVLLILTGLVTLAEANTASPRIIGGSDAPANRWPWMAQIVVDDPNQERFQLCGGSHLSEDWILTAAHCLETVDGNGNSSFVPAANVRVYIGDEGHSPDVQQILIHPDYENLNHDLALLRINPQSNTQWPSIGTLSLFDQLEDLPFSQRDEAVTSLGWGTTSDGSLSDTLQEVQLDYVPQQQCRNLSPLTISEVVVCAAELNPVNGVNQDSCFGDSGGPLFLGRERSPWLVGITSFGLNTCATGSPGGYTHVSAETRALESMSQAGGVPLVDLAPQWSHTPLPRFYQPLNGTQTLSASLQNHSHDNTADTPVLTLSLEGEQTATAEFNWPGCEASGGLFGPNQCTLNMSLAAGTGSNGEILLEANGSSDQAITVMLAASADQDDYRLRNNRIRQEVIFSDNPDLALSAVQQSGNASEATVTVTLSNRSTLNDATGGEIHFSLPVNTTLANAEALGCTQSNPLSCPVGDLPANASQTLTLTFSSDSGESRDVTFTGDAKEEDIPGDTDNTDTLTLRYPSPAPVGGGGSSGGGAPAILILITGLLLALRSRPTAAQTP